MFSREAGVVGRLSDHPGVVTAYDAGLLPDSRPYLIMELCPGGSLTQWLDPEERPLRGPDPPHGGSSCRCAGRLHARGVLHRDVKPANILIDSFGSPRLADFGLATVVGAEVVAERCAAADSRLCAPGGIREVGGHRVRRRLLPRCDAVRPVVRGPPRSRPTDGGPQTTAEAGRRADHPDTRGELVLDGRADGCAELRHLVATVGGGAPRPAVRRTGTPVAETQARPCCGRGTDSGGCAHERLARSSAAGNATVAVVADQGQRRIRRELMTMGGRRIATTRTTPHRHPGDGRGVGHAGRIGCGLADRRAGFLGCSRRCHAQRSTGQGARPVRSVESVEGVVEPGVVAHR